MTPTKPKKGVGRERNLILLRCIWVTSAPSASDLYTGLPKQAMLYASLNVPLFDLLRKYFAEYGYWTVALVLLLENAGIPLPGETTLLFAAAPLKRPRDAALHRARSGRRRAVLRKLESIAGRNELRKPAMRSTSRRACFR